MSQASHRTSGDIRRGHTPRGASEESRGGSRKSGPEQGGVWRPGEAESSSEGGGGGVGLEEMAIGFSQRDRSRRESTCGARSGKGSSEG